MSSKNTFCFRAPAVVWLSLLVLLALTAAPHTARADGTIPLWNVTGCPALDPYTAEAPMNASLTIAINNASSFTQQGAGCVISGAVTLVFKVQAMRALAVAAGLPSVSIVVQDIFLLGRGEAFPGIIVEVAPNGGAAFDVLPLDMIIKNVSLQADFCASASKPLVNFRFLSLLPPHSKILVQNVSVTAIACAAVSTEKAITGMQIDTLTLRNGTNVTISNIRMEIHNPSSLFTVRSVRGTMLNDDIVDAEPESAAPVATFQLSDVRVEVQGGVALQNIFVNVVVFSYVILTSAAVMLRDLRVVVRDVTRPSVSVYTLDLDYIQLGGRARLDTRSAEVLVLDSIVSGSLSGSRFTLVALTMTRCVLSGEAHMTVAAGRIVVSNCSSSSSDVSIAFLTAAVIHAKSSTILSGNATLTISGSSPSYFVPYPPARHPSADRVPVNSGIEIRDIHLLSRLRTSVLAVVFYSEDVQLQDQASVIVEGVAVRVDGASLYATQALAPPGVYAALLQAASSASTFSFGSNTSFVLGRARVEATRVDAAEIAAVGMQTSSRVTIGGSVTFRDVALVVAQSTARESAGVTSYLLWAKQGTSTTSANAALVLNKTCQRVGSSVLVPPGAALDSTIFGPVTGAGLSLNLTAGGRFTEVNHNSSQCTARWTFTASRNLVATATTATPFHTATFTSIATVSHTATLAVPPTAPLTSTSLASPAETNPAGQRGNAVGAASSDALADRPGPLAAVIVCSLIGLGVVVVAVALLWRMRKQKKETDQPGSKDDNKNCPCSGQEVSVNINAVEMDPDDGNGPIRLP